MDEPVPVPVPPKMKPFWLLKRTHRDSSSVSEAQADDSATDDEAASPGSASPDSSSGHREKRNSRRDLLHDLINRSIRGATGRSSSSLAPPPPLRGSPAEAQHETTVGPAPPHSSPCEWSATLAP